MRLFSAYNNVALNIIRQRDLTMHDDDDRFLATTKSYSTERSSNVGISQLRSCNVAGIFQYPTSRCWNIAVWEITCVFQLFFFFIFLVYDKFNPVIFAARVAFRLRAFHTKSNDESPENIPL